MESGKAGSNFELVFVRFLGGGVHDRLGVLEPGDGAGERLDDEGGGVAYEGKAGAGENMGDEGSGGRGWVEYRRGELYLRGMAGIVCSVSMFPSKAKVGKRSHIP
jgi:hypothetical protein